jgi:hypothetical protein
MTTDNTVAEIEPLVAPVWASNSIATHPSGFPIVIPLFGNLAVF